MRRKVILDWASAKGVLGNAFNGYAEKRLQVAAYAAAYNDAAHRGGAPPVDGCGIVYLDKEEGLPRFVDVTPDMAREAAAFEALREYYRFAVEFAGKAKLMTADGLAGLAAVTEVVKVLDKPALVSWAAGCAVQVVRDNLPAIRSAASSPGQVEAILQSAQKNYRQVSQKAKDVGKMVHLAIQANLRGEPEAPFLSEPLARRGFDAFLAWARKVDLKAIAVETNVSHATRGYAGRIDFLGTMEME